MVIQYVVRKGTHVGRGHLLDLKNRQDALSTFDGDLDGKRVVVGVICDGCSEGKSSEVGANLACNFLVREACNLVGQRVSLSLIPEFLYLRLLSFLADLVDGYRFSNFTDRVEFIKDNLLFTVVGFILTAEEVVIFNAGDGTIILNDQVKFIFADDMPMYPAYHLIDRSLLVSASELPTCFDIETYLVRDVLRLAIGSDAWKDEPELVNQIWGFKNPAGLQRKINQWSKNDRKFYDDVSVITVEVEHVGSD